MEDFKVSALPECLGGDFMKKWKREQIELVVYTMGLFIVGYINKKEIYALFVIILIIYFGFKNFHQDK